ncbi:MAG: queuosine precursor transporter [Hyphomicrobiaceae bacterium]
MRSYNYYPFVMAAFVAVLLCSNLIGPAKITEVDLPFWGPIAFSTAVVFFPLSYVFGDILTEVYGYARARRVIWAGFGALLFATLMSVIVLALPPAAFWDQQGAYETVFGNTWRIVVASISAYFCGEFVNSYVLAKMKLWQEGRHLWGRTIGSTIAGQSVDSAIFFPIAFYNSGILPNEAILGVALTELVLKIGIEAVLTPFTYAVVGHLKRAENEDYYDRDTDFSPFRLEV